MNEDEFPAHELPVSTPTMTPRPLPHAPMPRVTACLLGLLGFLSGLQAEVTRTQTLELQSGWNAVYLEVDPLDPSPSAVFAGLPVETVATYWPRKTPVESVVNPADAPWKQEGWGMWYAPHRPEAAVSSLHAISGHRAYLIRASRPAVWNLEGRVELRRIRWQTDSFNLLGFAVDPENPPTFAGFFKPSEAHRDLRCLRLVDGVWTLLRNPETTRMRSGEAYWIHCNGASDYQGPLDIRPQGSGGLRFGVMTEALHLRIASQSASSATLSVIEDPQGERPPLPLAYATPNRNTLGSSWTPLRGPVPIPNLTPTDPADVALRLNWSALEPAAREALLCITDHVGSRAWIPVHAEPHLP